MLIRPATTQDAPAIWSVLAPTIRAGETLAIDRDISESAALAYWLSPDRQVFVAQSDDQIVATSYIRPNQFGGGRHICNAGYVVDPSASGRGIARALCLHSLDHARQQGYRGMQFNFVVSTNTRAVHLWHTLGFQTIARLPAAFQHPTLGYVDALIMFQSLL